MRYAHETSEKSNGITYTPPMLADYLAKQMLNYHIGKYDNEIKILDPAIGGGELVISLLNCLDVNKATIKIVGYETDLSVIAKTEKRIKSLFPEVILEINNADFITAYLHDEIPDRFDCIIANPPYIRTQILGSEKAQEIAKKAGLSGRIDIYYAFIIYAAKLLTKTGIAGFITSNKFMTIKSGVPVRNYLMGNTKLHRITDFGDTKLFDKSVLPCIVVFSKGKTTQSDVVDFTSIYENKNADVEFTNNCTKIRDIFESISENKTVFLEDGRCFDIRQGCLNPADYWVISTNETSEWLNLVEAKTKMRFSDIGKIKVGIKTTADNVFIGDSWPDNGSEPELLLPLITHRNAGQILSRNPHMWKVLYTHTVDDGKRVAIDVEKYPNSYQYLLKHRSQLEKRKYIAKANRNWFEIWVPQNPSSWKNRKIVFRDISEQPEFWLDETGAVVNGDCYWIEIADSITEDIELLALAVANSPFIEKFYDIKFNNKLYSKKRRYQSHYVEEFPIPDVQSPTSQEIIRLMRTILGVSVNSDEFFKLKKKIDRLVYREFTTPDIS